MVCSARMSQRLNTPSPDTDHGTAFWADGERFYVRGIAYQPGGEAANADPLADPDVCTRDIERFEELGINAIRVYSLDSTLDHDECMGKLADAGIYLMADINSPNYSINRDDPVPSYNADYLEAVFAVVDEFAKYDNTMLFFSANEVINNENTTNTAPYIKATTRDVKNYMRAQGLRRVPIGYSAADVSANRMEQAHYFNCGPDSARSDFFAINDYSWCNSDFVTADWDKKVANFTDYGVPLFLSEFGCRAEGSDRRFGEVESLMHSNMTSVYSGGLMYEYSLEPNQYGIVEIDGSSTEETSEYDNLVEAYSRWPAPSGDGNPQHSTTHANDCPTRGPMWDVNPTLLPAMPEEAEIFMEEGAGSGPGLRGPGSQYSNNTSTADAEAGDPSPTGSARPRHSNGSGSGNSNDDDDDDDDNAAAGIYFERGALAVTCATVLFTLFGTLLL